MSRLFCRSASSKSSRSSLPSLPDIVNEEEYNIPETTIDSHDWNIPKVPIREIYKSSFSVPLSFTSDSSVKTVEQVYSLNEHHDTCQLLSKEVNKKLKETKMNFLHIGSIQVAVKPLVRLGTNASVLLCLRDARHKDYSTSMLGIVESSLHKVPIHFDCFPDFTFKSK